MTRSINEDADFPIDIVTAPGGGQLGLSHCPGRSGGASGLRNLERDLSVIEAWGATHLVTLVETQEFERLGVPGFADAVRGRSWLWHHVPIPDFGVPTMASRTAWLTTGPALAIALARNERVLVHCAAGLGRSGTIVAKLLVDLGVPAETAMARVRAARPGAIETEAQAAFVRDGGRLLP